MLCQNCGRSEATTHIKRVINGETSESHLCRECASNLGYDDMFPGFGFNLSDIFGGFLGETAAPAALRQSSGAVRCGKCGNSWNDIVREGRLGCADCYRTFFDRLQPSLQRIHGKIRHSGKISAGAAESGTAAKKSVEELKAERREQLEKEMKQAVDSQNFEQAAVIRDQLRELG